jgi:predicted lactoylglutathione lyase
MNPDDFPAPKEGFVITHVLVVADQDRSRKFYRESSAKGAEFLTEPKDHGQEIRAYLRDPDGHLIEVGQVTGLLS